jgi:hypothetical protein
MIFTVFWRAIVGFVVAQSALAVRAAPGALTAGKRGV